MQTVYTCFHTVIQNMSVISPAQSSQTGFPRYIVPSELDVSFMANCWLANALCICDATPWDSNQSNKIALLASAKSLLCPVAPVF